MQVAEGSDPPSEGSATDQQAIALPSEQSSSQGFAYGSGGTASRRTGGDWAALRADEGLDGKGADYLANLGQAQDYNINVDHGQSWQYIDSLFAGNFLGKKSDIADGSLRNQDIRTFGHLQGDYYVSPRFLETVALHITKNILCDQGALDCRVPLILGIWGDKGQGKSFQTELVFKELGVVPIVMSAGELENEVAGTPGLLIRERYRTAAQVIKNQGKLSCLMINDLDAGIGRFQETQCTVNNQMVVGTLMNLCDNPNLVSVGKDWREDDMVPRVPIIVTGNDFSRLYAPLIRDGRMEKFFWAPSHEDRRQILHAMFRDDGLSLGDMDTLLETFPSQSLDFYGAIRAGCYDGHLRDWLTNDVMQGLPMDQWGDPEHTKELRRRLIFKQDLPNIDSVVITMDLLLEEGRRLAQEQQHVNENKLSEEYLKNLVREKQVEEQLADAPLPPPTPPPPMEKVRVDTSQILERSIAEHREAGTLQYIAVGVSGLEEEEVEDEYDGLWRRTKPESAMQLLQEEGYTFVDIRPTKDFDRDHYNSAVSMPAVTVAGFGEARRVTSLSSFLPNFQAQFPDREAKILVCGGEGGEFADEVMAQLQEEGYTAIAEVRGGYTEWAKLYRPNGERRWTFSPMQHLGGGLLHLDA